MANNLNDIVTVNIDIAAPAVDAASFDNLLIVGLPPVKTPEKPLPDVGVYADLSEVTEAGYKTVGDDADPVGIAARIAFSQNPKPARIYIAAQKPTDELALETPVDTLTRALDTDGWYVICAAGIPENELEEIAEWTEAQTKMFCYTFLSQTDPVGSVFLRTFSICGLLNDNDSPAEVPVANSYLHVAMAAKFLSYSAGEEMWENKVLASVYPSNLSSTLRKKFEDGNSNYFVRRAGRNISRGGKTRGGEWIDVIRGRDWLQNDMQLRLFNLQLMDPKIPYTNSGIAKAQNAMIASLKAAQGRGIVAESEYDEDGVLVPGFETRVPNSMSLTATQKASRVLTDCKFWARLAGAIRIIRVDGSLTY